MTQAADGIERLGRKRGGKMNMTEGERYNTQERDMRRDQTIGP